MGTAVTDFRPMLAKAEIADALDKGHFPSPLAGSDGWVMEPKHDGMRAIVEVDRDLPQGIRITSRSGLEYTDCLLPLHLDRLKLSIPNGSIIDGELAAIKRVVDIIDTDGTSKAVPVVDFNLTMRVMGSSPEKARNKQVLADQIVTLLVFDVVKWEGFEITDLPWCERRKCAERLPDFLDMDPKHMPMFLNPVFASSRLTYDTFLDHKIEGAIMKRVYAKYVKGKRPSKTWIKIKAEQTFDVVVMGFTKGNGKYEEMIGAIEFGAYDSEGELKYVGRCSGMDDNERQIWTDARNAWDPAVHTGKYVIEVKANEMVGSGEYRTPRHPQYVVLRTDKAPAECLMEQFKEIDR